MGPSDFRVNALLTQLLKANYGNLDLKDKVWLFDLARDRGLKVTDSALTIPTLFPLSS